MSWNPVTGAVGYRLMYSTKADMSAPFYRNIASGTTGGYGGLTPSTTYYVKIKALTAAGADLTPYSAAVAAKTLPARARTPHGPQSYFVNLQLLDHGLERCFRGGWLPAHVFNQNRHERSFLSQYRVRSHRRLRRVDSLNDLLRQDQSFERSRRGPDRLFRPGHGENTRSSANSPNGTEVNRPKHHNLGLLLGRGSQCAPVLGSR